MKDGLRIIVSGGGTGGHIFPAISIANAVKAQHPEAEILFVGAEGRMEMKRVPAAGYPIKALPICGFDRKNWFKNVSVLFKIIKSRRMAKKILREFRPHAVVGVGGYASGPMLNMAASMGFPTLIQEQNSYAGVTNKLLALSADKICVAYEGMERFFPKEKIILTGNPVRQGLLEYTQTKKEAAASFGFDGAKKTVLMIGGSLGAGTLNKSVLEHLDTIAKSKVQFIWQTGSYYYADIQKALAEKGKPENLYVTDFISKMEDAYAAADLVVSRAGASSISELCLLGKPSILVPSPNVAEDHQTKNALALADRDAALFITDAEAPATLIDTAVQTVRDDERLLSLSKNIYKLALKDSANRIAEEVYQLAVAYQKSKKMKIEAVYFIGIGGIGMSAIARYFLHEGVKVGGYDKTPTDLTRKLEAEGACIHYEENVDLISHSFRNPETCLVVYTPAIPEDHAERVYFLEHGFTVQKRAQVLGTLTRSHKGLCVAGTHGKTTTSSMAAHLLHQSSVDCHAFLGGITKNYGTNYILAESSDYVVIEADEFDRSFHWLSPFATVITSTDPDHLDIYGTKEAYLDSFRKYSSLVVPGGFLIVHEGLELQPNPQEGVKVYSYGRESGDFHAENIRIGGGEIVFDLVSPIESIQDIQLGVPVSINIDNGIAAMALAQVAGVSSDEIRKAMATFRGVDRRFDFYIKTPQKAFLTDYAHHPEEIRRSALSLRELYSGKKIMAVFQPHLYSRTHDFYQEFADSLSLFDEVLLTEIYPARELPIPGVSSELIYDRLTSGVEKRMCRKDETVECIATSNADVVVVLGAGDIESYAPQIKEILEKKW